MGRNAKGRDGTPTRLSERPSLPTASRNTTKAIASLARVRRKVSDALVEATLLYNKSTVGIAGRRVTKQRPVPFHRFLTGFSASS
jgi:hypothetical protein